MTPNKYKYTFCAFTFLFGCFFMINSVYTPAAPDKIAITIAIIKPINGVDNT
jgi:hypothetical protein